MPTHTASNNASSMRMFLCAAIVMLSFVNAAQAGAQTLTVEWTGERVTIAADNVPLASVLTELAQRTGSKVVGLEKAARAVTVDIRDALLLDALRTLLADVSVNYLFIPTLAPGAASYDRVTLWLRGSTASGAFVRQDTAIFDGADIVVDSPGFQPTPIPADNEVARLHADGTFGAGASEGSLLGLTKSADHNVRIMALQTLALQSTKAGLQAIQAALEDEHPFVRAEAMDMLVSQSPGSEAVGRLGSLVEHADPVVRGSAAMALGEQAGADADFLLQRALDDDDPSVRAFAAQSLKQQQGNEKRKR